VQRSAAVLPAAGVDREADLQQQLYASGIARLGRRDQR
jgi:hypothetical protein